MTPQHTPGPWLRIDKADYAEIHAAHRPSSQAVALVGKPADADLITAAPDMLDLIRRLAVLVDRGELTGDTAAAVEALGECDALHAKIVGAA